MPRLCILTQYFPPEMGAPQVRLFESAERLIDAGWDVEALTSIPNYPAGKVFPNYSPWRAVVEQTGRVRTVRVPLWPSSRGFASRVGTYLTFAAASLAIGSRLCTKPDLLLVESPPLFIGFAARSLSRRWRIPYVFNVSDLWPESAVRMGVVRAGGVAARVAEKFELSLYRGAAGVTGQSEEIVASVRRRTPGIRAEVITNGVSPARFGRELADVEARALLGREPGPVFVFAGLIGHAQGLQQLLDIAAALPADVPGRFVIVGDGPEREALDRRIRRNRIPRVRLVPAQPRHRIPSVLAAADAAVIMLGAALPGAVPSKIYEAMGSSLPILLVADGEAARRVESAGAGLCVRPGDVGGAIEAFTRLATDETLRLQLGAAGRRAAETTYDRARIAERLEQFLRTCLPSPERRDQPPHQKVPSVDLRPSAGSDTGSVWHRIARHLDPGPLRVHVREALDRRGVRRLRVFDVTNKDRLASPVDLHGVPSNSSIDDSWTRASEELAQLHFPVQDLTNRD